MATIIDIADKTTVNNIWTLLNNAKGVYASTKYPNDASFKTPSIKEMLLPKVTDSELNYNNKNSCILSSDKHVTSSTYVYPEISGEYTYELTVNNNSSVNKTFDMLICIVGDKEPTEISNISSYRNHNAYSKFSNITINANSSKTFTVKKVDIAYYVTYVKAACTEDNISISKLKVTYTTRDIIKSIPMCPHIEMIQSGSFIMNGNSPVNIYLPEDSDGFITNTPMVITNTSDVINTSVTSSGGRQWLTFVPSQSFIKHGYTMENQVVIWRLFIFTMQSYYLFERSYA